MGNYYFWSFVDHVFHIELSLSVVPTKSDSDVILCLELLSKHKRVHFN